MFIKSESGEVSVNADAIETMSIAEIEGFYKVIIYPKNPSALAIPDAELIMTGDKSGFVESTHGALETATQHLRNLGIQKAKTNQRKLIANYMKKRKH